MNKKLICILTCAAIAIVACVFGTYRNGETRTISVNGECITTAPKDRTAITLRVKVLDTSAAESMRRASGTASAITDYLKTLDVKMQTTDFESYERTEWNHALEKSVTLGTETTIAIEVSSDKIETIEQVLAQFAGVDNVYTENLRMFTSDETLKPIVQECLGTATQNARERADALASGDGRRAGRLLSISHGANVTNQYLPTANFMRASAKVAEMAGSSYDAGGIVAKDTDVRVSVSAIFQIR